MSAATTKLRSIWTAVIGDKVHSYASRYYNARGEITALLSGSRAEVRLYNGTVAIIPLPDLELL